MGILRPFIFKIQQTGLKMNNHEHNVQKQTNALNTLKDHYELPSITFTIPRPLQWLIIPGILFIIRAALKKMGILP